MVLGSFQCRGILLLLHIVGQGPAVLAAGVGRVGYMFIYIYIYIYMYIYIYIYIYAGDSLYLKVQGTRQNTLRYQ